MDTESVSTPVDDGYEWFYARTTPVDTTVTGHRYGVRFMPTWPHISLGLSAHLDRKFGHVSVHLPVGVLVLGFIGADG